MEFYKKRYRAKQIAILGFGREGQSTYRFLRQQVGLTGLITLVDENITSLKTWHAEHPTEKVTLMQFSESQAAKLNQFDLIFRTPGLSRTKLVAVEPKRLTSQTNEFLLTQASHTIGITGTKGKSTTSSLVAQTLKALGSNTQLLGNIGQPALDLLAAADGSTWFVYEISSYQAENISRPPAIGVVLNLFEEHLDHYIDFADYIAAKLRLITLPQQMLAVYGCDNQLLKSKRSQFRAKQVRSFGELKNRLADETGIYLRGDEIVRVSSVDHKPEVLLLTGFRRHLKGRHNLINALVALVIAEFLVGLSRDNLPLVQQAIAEFKGLAHRLEYIGRFRQIDFYDDSISTIPEAMERAIEALPNVQTVIIGGQDRGIDRTAMIDYLAKRPNLKLICLPDTGHQIFDQLTNQKYKVDSLDQAVRQAYMITDAGKACVLSPAAPSYGFFVNFEQRGQAFKHLVIELANSL